RVAAVDTESLGCRKEIIVCDDGSTDRTVAAIETAGIPGVTLVRHERNRGKGAAIRTALSYATGDYVLIQDADLEYDVDDYPKIIKALAPGVDAVYGSRFLQRRYPHGMHPLNFLANKILTVSANVLYGHHITDEATCFKVVRTDLLRSLELECERFEFCPEVTAKLGLRRATILEVPIRYEARDVGGGKKVRWTDGIQALWVLLKHRIGIAGSLESR
ncbi:MAG: glycosyltransferase family 2 protein, partial [Pseudomonadota bacterium]